MVVIDKKNKHDQKLCTTYTTLPSSVFEIFPEFSVILSAKNLPISWLCEIFQR